MADLITGVFSAARPAWIMLAVYLTALFVLRQMLFSGMSQDDAEQLMFAQAWAWGYKPNQPPLYTWSVMALQSVFGVLQANVAALKFTALFAMYTFYYLAAHRLLADHRLAVVAVLTVFGFFYVGWDMVVNYSNSALLLAAISATLWAAVRLDRDASWADYAVLGLCISVGLLAKFNFLLFVVPLAIAMVSVPAYRACLVNSKIILSALVVAALAGPYYGWFLSSPDGLAAVDTTTSQAGQTASYLTDMGRGLWALGRGLVAIVLPGALLSAVLLWAARRRDGHGPAPGRRLIAVYCLTTVLTLVLFVLVYRVTFIQNHWLIVIMPLAILGAGLLDPERLTDGLYRRFGGVMAVLALAIPMIFVVNAVTGPKKCRKCNFFIPYEALAAQIKAAGFSEGTILAIDNPNILGGNLRAHFPDTRIISTRFVPFVPPPRQATGKCLVVWNDVRQIDIMKEYDITSFVAKYARLALPRASQSQVAEAWLPGNPDRLIRLRYEIFADDLGDCH